MTEPLVRCSWAVREPDVAYHDAEWGVPLHDDRRFFEMLTLEGAQAGLSWTTILRRREGYRAAFDGFDPALVAAYDDARVARLCADERIIRNRAKIRSAVANARAFLAVQREFGSFDAYFWGFAGGEPIVTRRPDGEDPPARTDLSDRLSADLRARGFTFVGPTIVYALMQATGVVDDHRASCFRARPQPSRPPTRRRRDA